jgi:hypothetical protein
VGGRAEEKGVRKGGGWTSGWVWGVVGGHKCDNAAASSAKRRAIGEGAEEKGVRNGEGCCGGRGLRKVGAT